MSLIQNPSRFSDEIFIIVLNILRNSAEGCIQNQIKHLGWSFYENSEWLKAIHSKKLEPHMFSLEFLSAFSFQLCLSDWVTFSHDTAVLYATFNAHFWCLELLNNALDTVDISITFQIHWFMTFNFKPLYLLISHSRKTPMVKILFNKVADL